MNILKLKNKLKQYRAKSNGQSIQEHNDEMINILNQLKKVYGLGEKLYNDIDNSTIFHDTGKIHKEFTENIESRHRKVRHEILSASLSELPLNNKIAILTHHKSLQDLEGLYNNEYYKTYLDEFSKEIDLPTENIIDLIKSLNKKRKSYKILHDKDLMLLKGYLQYCDHTASAGIKALDIGFNGKNSFKFNEYNSIQRETFSLHKNKDDRDIIINAMTGLGKSSTSLFWSDLVQNNDSSRRIFYLLPFTASINSLYKDFKSRAISVGMLHSKAKYFLNKELSNNKDKANISEEYDLFKKTTKQVTVCTIFQLIKVFFSCKRFEMLLSQMNNSIFIVDEIHCFQTKELMYILETLKYLKENFNINICIMSASIPTCLLDVIKNKLNINKVITPELKDLIVRHHINYIDDILINNIDRIEKDLKKGKQVLVCVNSVGLSQRIYDIFKDKYKAKLIHGKFNTRDRELAEKDLKTQQILIGTQSIEVSLDISYDVMYTELSPFDSLLQRFGRVNRKGEKGISEIHIFNDTSNVYKKELLDNTLNVLNIITNLDGGIIHEEKVNNYLDKVYIEFDHKTYNKYSTIYNEMINDMMVGWYHENYNDEMSNSDSISVLPVSLKDEYIGLIKIKNYEEANSLFVNIKNYKKSYYYDEDLHIHITNFKYTGKKGLEVGIEDDEYMFAQE